MRVYLKENLKEYTTFKIGGCADVICEPKDTKELSELIKFLKENSIIYYILGNGSNILVSDKGVRGCVIHIGKDMSKIKVIGNKIEAESGALLSDVVQTALKHKLHGLEELWGIPGSVGGAIAMNAGAYKKEISNIISNVMAINEKGRIVRVSKDALEFDYRKSAVFEKNLVITSAVFNLQEGKKEDIQASMDRYIGMRKAKQPLEYPSAGSIFKRPEGSYASLLIDKCCLKGEFIGDAEVSEKHAGFIINKGNATAKDVYKLMGKVKEVVDMYFNVKLEPEIKLWGNF